MPERDPHDPGPAVAGRRAEEAGDAGRLPIRVDGGMVRCGTASWTDPTMTAPGVFYPREVDSAEERLRHYSGRFPVVEVDATYYAVPVPRTAEVWVERTPEHFLFDVKAHALMTGQPTETARLPRSIREQLPVEVAEKRRIYRRDLPEELLAEVFRQFCDGIAPLTRAGRLGAVFLQFPPWVFPSNEAREVILETRERLDLPIAVEFRHGGWFNERNAERTVRFLVESTIPYVVVDEPQGFRSSVPPVVVRSSPDLAVFRFHGRNAQTWERKGIRPSERFRYLYDEDELADWTSRIAAVAAATRETHVIFNNCHANYGTTNARETARLLEELHRHRAHRGDRGGHAGPAA